MIIFEFRIKDKEGRGQWMKINTNSRSPDVSSPPRGWTHWSQGCTWTPVQDIWTVSSAMLQVRSLWYQTGGGYQFRLLNLRFWTALDFTLGLSLCETWTVPTGCRLEPAVIKVSGKHSATESMMLLLLNIILRLNINSDLPADSARCRCE